MKTLGERAAVRAARSMRTVGVMSPGHRVIVTVAHFALALQGCIAAKLGDYCKGAGFANVDNSSLGLVLGAPTHRFSDSPVFEIYSPSQAEPAAVLQFKLTSTALPWPADLDETPCKGLDWRTFHVEVESEQWTKFWSLPRPMYFEGHIGIFDSTAPLRMSEFGFAIVEVATGKALMSCGCYWS